jgi:outer membrane lipoprotein SlyB
LILTVTKQTFWNAKNTQRRRPTLANPVLGLALALIGGDKKLASAGAGAVVGGAVGASAGETSQRDIIRNCLTGRGYKVLK